MEHSTIPLAPTPSSHAPSTYYLRRKAHRLGISDTAFDDWRTVGALHILAKKRYYTLAHHYHPDKRVQQAKQTASPNLTQGTPLKGTMFKYFTDAYRAILAVPASTHLHRKTRLANYPRRFDDTTSLEPLPMHEASLPWAMDRQPLTLGFGWQETYP